MKIPFFLIPFAACAFLAQAYASEPVVKESFFVVRGSHRTTTVTTHEGARYVNEINKYQENIARVDDQLSKKQKELKHGWGFISDLEERKLGGQVHALTEELADLKAEKLARFGPNADKLADKLETKAIKLGNLWDEYLVKVSEAERNGRAKPKMSVAIAKVESEIEAATEELGKHYEKSLGSAARNKMKARTKYGIAALPIAAATLLAGANGSGAEAAELPKFVAPATESAADSAPQEEEKVEVAIGVLGEE